MVQGLDISSVYVIVQQLSQLVPYLLTPSCLSVSSGPPQGSLEPTPSPSCPPLTAPPMTNANDILTTFDPDPADVALSSIPGQEAFDPRTHCFSEDDLKPQPVIKKARKMLVPDSLKVKTVLLYQCSVF